ncbi:hypothetical protein BX667DRAFT_292164 [Coemansia mojavensis]|nr:hypothetical protein BX667DRAFT_292164 [Coemansia mojavensis]
MRLLNWTKCWNATAAGARALQTTMSSRMFLQTALYRNQQTDIDPVQHRRLKRKGGRGGRQSLAQDISVEPTKVVRVCNLPPGTTATDIRHFLGGSQRKEVANTKSLHFEFDFNLRSLRSCRVSFVNANDAADFAMQVNKRMYAGHRIRTEFVQLAAVPNPTQQKYLQRSLGRVVFLYGYPAHVHQHQIRDFYRDYDLVDTKLPGVQPAPQLGEMFLVRKGAFLLHFATEAEARRFVRDVYGTSYVTRGDGEDAPKQEFLLKAILLQ